MGAFSCHGNQTKRQIIIILAIFVIPYPFNNPTKLGKHLFIGFGEFVLLKHPSTDGWIMAESDHYSSFWTQPWWALKKKKKKKKKKKSFLISFRQDNYLGEKLSFFCTKTLLCGSTTELPRQDYSKDLYCYFNVKIYPMGTLDFFAKIIPMNTYKVCFCGWMDGWMSVHTVGTLSG